MIDLKELDRLIATTPDEGQVAVLKRGWLEQVRLELATGAAALAELAALRAQRETQV